MLRRFSRSSAVLSLFVVAGLCGCDFVKSVSGPPAAKPAAPAALNIPAPSSPGPTQPPELAAPSAGNTIRIASFNIQVFGTTKLAKPQVMDVLTKVVRRFDCVAIQEVRSTDATVMPRFVEMINAGGGRYDYVVGPRLGRTNSKEQYAFVFNTARLELDRGSVYTVSDPRDLLHREPLVARFRVRGPPPGQAFSFNLVNIHTDPDETVGELNALADVFVGVQRDGSGEDDVILLGDLNVDEYHLGRLGQLPGIAHAVTGTTTNTRRDKMYDNLVFDRRATVEFTGRWGVVDLEREFGLTADEALAVSDHCPVWAEFGVLESAAGAGIAAGSGGLTR
jgi:endonuclease/exonuclease/phosphatase family metal-dependent hydrolase